MRKFKRTLKARDKRIPFILPDDVKYFIAELEHKQKKLAELYLNKDIKELEKQAKILVYS